MYLYLGDRGPSGGSPGAFLPPAPHGMWVWEGGEGGIRGGVVRPLNNVFFGRFSGIRPERVVPKRRISPPPPLSPPPTPPFPTFLGLGEHVCASPINKIYTFTIYCSDLKDDYIPRRYNEILFFLILNDYQVPSRIKKGPYI